MESNIFENLPTYVKYEDHQNRNIVKFLCDQGIQPQYDEMLDIISRLAILFNTESATSNGTIDWICEIFGLHNYEDHWLGVGINPDWSPQKKRDVLGRISNYWRNKGTINAFYEALMVWGFDDPIDALPFEVRVDIPLYNTQLSRHDYVSLWTYRTPFNINQYQNLSSSYRLGIGDRWEKTRHLLKLTEELRLVSNWVWDNTPPLSSADLSLDFSDFHLSFDHQFEDNRFRLSDNSFIDINEDNKKLVNQPILVPYTDLKFTRLQNSGLWDNNCWINYIFTRNIDDVWDDKFFSPIYRLPVLYKEIVPANLSVRSLFSFVFNGDRNYQSSSNSGDLLVDYPELNSYLVGDNISLTIETNYGTEKIILNNSYWYNENTKNNYITSGYTYDGSYNHNTFTNRFRAEFAYFPDDLILKNKDLSIHKLLLKIGNEPVEEVVFNEVFPLLDNANFIFTFNLKINLI